MQAEIISGLAAWVTIVSGLLLVGSVGVGLGRWLMKRREGPASDRILLHDIARTLGGEKATGLNPDPPTGLVKSVENIRTMAVSAATTAAEVKTALQERSHVIDDISKEVATMKREHGTRLTRLELSTKELKAMMRPNGGNTQDPGDVLQRILKNQERLEQALGISEEEGDSDDPDIH